VARRSLGRLDGRSGASRRERRERVRPPVQNHGSQFIILFFRLELSLRQQYVLTYADYLRSDAGLWRIAVSYMGVCGEIGLQRMDEVLLRVPIVPRGLDAATSIADEESGVTAVPPVLQEVVQTCFEYGREHVRRTVCSVSFLLIFPFTASD
jgi:hypothetical protein